MAATDAILPNNIVLYRDEHLVGGVEVNLDCKSDRGR